MLSCLHAYECAKHDQAPAQDANAPDKAPLTLCSSLGPCRRAIWCHRTHSRASRFADEVVWQALSSTAAETAKWGYGFQSWFLPIGFPFCATQGGTRRTKREADRKEPTLKAIAPFSRL